MTALTIVRAMPFFDPAIQFGGVISQSREITRRLAERGHRIHVVTTDNGQPWETPRDRWVERDGYRVFYARSGRINRVVPYWTPMLAGPLREVLPEADVLQLNVGLTLANRLGRKLAKEFGVPYVYNAEGCLCPTRLQIKRWQKALFTSTVERRVLRDAAALQALTSKDAEDLARLGAPRERIHVIPNGVDPIAEAITTTTDTRAKFGIPKNARLLLFLGRIHRIKGIELLLASMSQTDGIEPWLLIAGPDEDGSRASLETLARRLGIADRVRFSGPLDGEEKEAAFAAADIFALTSYTEGLPMAVLEACARGLPCLLTTHCNVPEVETGGAGLVRPADATALANALEDMFANPEQLATMGSAARRLIRDQFSLERVVDELSELYRSL